MFSAGVESDGFHSISLCKDNNLPIIASDSEPAWQHRGAGRGEKIVSRVRWLKALVARLASDSHVFFVFLSVASPENPGARSFCSCIIQRFDSGYARSLNHG